MPLRWADNSTLPLERPAIVGILNVTPDSFSDGGRFAHEGAAVARGLEMAAEGAELIDIGGESTRPGSQPVDAAEQMRRVLSVVRKLRAALDHVHPAGTRVHLSIDTTLPEVAAAALDAGCSLINDISAGLGWAHERESGMLALAAERSAPIVLMHMQGTPATMQQAPLYGDVVGEVLAFLAQRVQAAQRAGIANDRIVLDPGIGFGKTAEHNLALLASLHRFVATGYPVLLGASRKKFMGALSGSAGSSANAASPVAPAELVGATCAATALAVHQGVQLLRVHDVKPNRQAADLAWRVAQAAAR